MRLRPYQYHDASVYLINMRLIAGKLSDLPIKVVIFMSFYY